MSQPLPSRGGVRQDCDLPSRCDFLRTTAAGLVTVAAGAGLYSAGALRLAAAENAAVPAETLVAQFYRSLNEEQKKVICFPFDHPLRSKVDNNWFIVKPRIGSFLNKDQQQMVRDIFMDLHSEEYADKVLQAGARRRREGGFSGSAVAMFGEPGEKFEFVFTGRHVTRRCDGNSVEGEGFGGPIFYGHAAHGFNEKADHPQHLLVSGAAGQRGLQGARRQAAQVGPARNAPTRAGNRRPSPSRAPITGWPASRDRAVGRPEGPRPQGDGRPARPVPQGRRRQGDEDDRSRRIRQPAHGVLQRQRSDGNSYDIGNDGVWDVWQIEGPNMVWYFRGEPHVHTWVHVRDPVKANASIRAIGGQSRHSEV